MSSEQEATTLAHAPPSAVVQPKHAAVHATVWQSAQSNTVGPPVQTGASSNVQPGQ
jgi:hypothetical protein